MKLDNELHREFMGVSGFDPFNGTISSARKAMFATHMSQCLVFNHSTPRRIQTGMEQEYGKYTFSVKMPVDGQIIKIIERYRPKIGEGAIPFSPQSIVIYEDEQTKEVGMINIPRYCSYHQYFGFEYQRRPGADEIRVGASIKAGTIFTDSPSIDDAGNYKYGRNLNVAYMSHPAVSEDGIMISRDVPPMLSFKTYETRIVEWGNKRMPLNLYGDVNNFKPFPDIGEYVRSDGLLMCLRNYDKDLAIVDQSIYDLMEIDHIFDKGTYTSTGGRIIDIRVHHDNMGQAEELTGMDGQAVKYDRARREFYQELLAEYHRLRRLRGDALRLTPELHRLIVEAMAVVDDDPQRVQKLYRRNTLDIWRVEFVIEYVITPTIGFKLTDTFGGN